MDKITIKEVIIVEGKDDISAVKRAVVADVIQVNGHSIKKKDAVLKLTKAYKSKGLIILTDPDFAGESIRKHINKFFPNSKNAFISRNSATKNNDVGVENASPESIVKALLKARCEIQDKKEIFDYQFLLNYGLTGREHSVLLRQEIGDLLGIGYANAKQFLSRLNSYGITEDEFLVAYNEAINKLKI